MRPRSALVLLQSAALWHVPGSAWVSLLGTGTTPNAHCPCNAVHPSSSHASRRGGFPLQCCSSSCEERDEAGARKGGDLDVQVGSTTSSSGVQRPPPEQVEYGFWAPASKELQDDGSWAPASKNGRFGGIAGEPHVRNYCCSLLNGNQFLRLLHLHGCLQCMFASLFSNRLSCANRVV